MCIYRVNSVKGRDTKRGGGKREKKRQERERGGGKKERTRQSG